MHQHYLGQSYIAIATSDLIKYLSRHEHENELKDQIVVLRENGLRVQMQREWSTLIIFTWLKQ